MLLTFRSSEEFVITRVSTVFSFVLFCTCIHPSFARQEQNPGPPAAVFSPPAGIVGSVNVRPQPDGLAIEIAVSVPTLPKSDRLAKPDRLVFDFPGCELEGSNRHILVNLGPVQKLRLSLFRVHPPVTRVVVDSNEPLHFEMQPVENGIVIKIPFPKAGAIPDTSTRHPSPVEREHAVLGQPQPKQSEQPKQPEQEIAIRAAASHPHAYGLLAKAKALNVGDLQTLEDKAKAGDPEAETTLALAYHAAVLLKKDEPEALRLLHKAADQGFMAAQESLGIFAEAGVGMEHPAPAEALDWYKKAARQGSLDAATNIALMYADGKGVAKDPQQAVTWFRQAAEAGDATAQYNLALMYGRGNGIPRDNQESVRWLTAAADQNVVPAILDLANVSMHPPDSAAADVGRAIRYYEKAADLGSGLAQAILGSIYANGAQGKPDYEQAVKWYRKAAEQGQPDGQFGLGVRYALGQGVPVDLEEARRLFTAAADQGHRGAQFDLGNLYEDGQGTPVDRSLAAHYYQLAAEQGMVRAQYRLGLLLAKGNGPQSDRVSAYKWLMLAQDRIQESGPALSDLRKSMNAQEIADAEREVDRWRIAHKSQH
jgi:TPR repeat protein